MGYNLAALRYMQRQTEATHNAGFFERDMSDAERIAALRNQASLNGDEKKRKRVTIKA